MVFEKIEGLRSNLSIDIVGLDYAVVYKTG